MVLEHVVGEVQKVVQLLVAEGAHLRTVFKQIFAPAGKVGACVAQMSRAPPLRRRELVHRRQLAPMLVLKNCPLEPMWITIFGDFNHFSPIIMGDFD
jgi:hypothetical protein